MGESLNSSADLVPAEDFYEACRIICSHVVHLGGLHWDFRKLHAMPIDPAFTRLVKSYLSSVLASNASWRGWKLPETTLALPWIVRLLPEINYIFWIRDPRDAILGAHFTDDLGEFDIPHDRSDDMRLSRATSWKYQLELVRSTPKPRLWTTVRFEDFVLHQNETLKRLERILGIPLARIPVDRRAVGRWRKDNGLHHFDFLAPDLFEYGYIDDGGSSDSIAQPALTKAANRAREASARARWTFFTLRRSVDSGIRRATDLDRRTEAGRGDDRSTMALGHVMAELRSRCRRFSLSTSVTAVDDGHPDWIVDGGILKNSQADYFSIGLREPEIGNRLLMMEQTEPALVMLLAADIDGVESVLLNLRTEPGLIGLTNLSTTIQSTPSNYLRRHGGKATPFIDVALDPEEFGTVLYDGAQFDWGDYYVYKTKRFLIVKLSAPAPAPEGYIWVSRAAVQRLLLEDNLITNDLRVCLPYLLKSGTPATDSDASQPVPERSSVVTRPDFSTSVVDSRGVRVGFFRTTTEAREVKSWVQPLLMPNEPMAIRLSTTGPPSGRLFAVEKRTQPGLLGRQLWFPAATRPGTVIRQVTTSAEGGRFWRFQIDVDVQRVDRPDNPGTETAWLTVEQLTSLVAAPLLTSLELRMAWSLACGE